ncbi:MAG: hypothetical protein LKE53_02450 [Oscillospiraceae bacterium]|jgi:ribosomal protein S3AE|nr:hypothetical protein [Oscillospiraceae bacterium]MDD3261050.1 hypothetical protein [Oscillospiraceae bacterium]
MEIAELEIYQQMFGTGKETELAYYRTYLLQTDYVAAKMAEAAYTGTKLTEDYSEILAKRVKCRQKIDELTGDKIF